ncbi:MAG: NAD-dependent epimerase/dehydratase family protein [Anaerolineales bacterium]|nr:NAD-dependent epimerase/dehydratase family protein [Chloroflexota bacterium]MBL6983199.1 NAD-dependent epimerase/dehydratase family protein [Anaerolineales bacterium]
MSEHQKILLTGGAGFIGSQVAQAYLDAGHKVIVVDDFSRGKRDHLPEGVRVYQVDISNRDALNEVFRLARPTIVSHHAALVSVRESSEQPEAYWKVNLQGTVNIVEAASKAGVRKLIYASSGGAIYGEAEVLPIPENASANPISPYGESKFAAEKMLWRRDGNLETVVLRYGNVYGPGQNALQNNGVIAIFTHALLTGKQPLIFGDGSQTRDYVHVRDVVDANLAASKPGVGGIYNIGTGKAHSLLDVYNRIALSLKVTTLPLFLPHNHYEVEHNVLDVQRARERLGWQPCIPFAMGLWETVQAIETDHYQKYASV